MTDKIKIGTLAILWVQGYLLLCKVVSSSAIIVFQNPNNAPILWTNTGDVGVTDCKVIAGTLGGGFTYLFYAGVGSILTIDRLRIEKGVNAIYSGGKVDIDNSIFEQGERSVIDTYNSKQLTSIQNTVFKDISTSNATQGAVVSVTNLYMDNCTFTNVQVQDGYGSAIRFIENFGKKGSFHIKNSTFENAGAGQLVSGAGGYAPGMGIASAIFGQSISSKVVIENCCFLNNKGSKYGGAINFLNSSPEILIDGCIFEGNEVLDTGNSYGWASLSNTDGGAISILNSLHGVGITEATITNSTFKDNEALASGGAIHISAIGPNSGIKILISNNTFIGNKSATPDDWKAGGAINIDGYVATDVIHNTFYKNEKASGGGGAIGSLLANAPFSSFDYFGENPSLNVYNIIDNKAEYSSGSEYNNINWLNPVTATELGNIGYDNGVEADADITIVNVFGSIEEKPTSTIAGSLVKFKPVYVLSILARGSDKIGMADKSGEWAYVIATYGTEKDQNGVTRANPPASGAVEVTTASASTFTVTYDLNTIQQTL